MFRSVRVTLQYGMTLLLLMLTVSYGGRLLTWFDQARIDLHEPTADLAGTVLLARLPFSFVENRGQWGARAKFRARKLGLAAQLEPNAITLQLTQQQWNRVLSGAVVRVVFKGSSTAVALTGEAQQAGSHHYFLGNSPARWRTDVPGYRRVLYNGLYEGIDLRVQEQRGRLEQTWLLKPNANLAQVAIRVQGVTRVALTSDGSLMLHTALGPIEQKPPTAWYERPEGRRQLVEVKFAVRDRTRYGFEVPNRDSDLPIVITAGLDVAPFLEAAAGDRPVVSAADTRGITTIAGRARSTTASANPLRALFPVFPSGSEVFVTQVNPTNNTLIYSTHLGGGGEELVHTVTVDASGNTDVGGWTSSFDFPTLPAASRPTRTAPSNFFVAWLDPAGSLRMRLPQAPVLADQPQERATESATVAPSAASPTGVAKAPRIPDVTGPPAPLTVTSYGTPSPSSCSPIHVEIDNHPQAAGAGMSLNISGIPADAGALLVIAGSEAEKRVFGSTVLVNRSDILLSLPTLPDPSSGRAELPVSLLHHILLPGRTVYIQAFSSGCSFTAPFRASNALTASLKPEQPS